MKQKPELILPAGDPEKARFAFEYGADAVYLGLGKYSMRKTEVKYTITEIGQTIKLAHKLGKCVYITFNIFAHEEHLKNLANDVKKIAKLGPDAFVVADMGVLNIVRDNAPKIPIHISTQQNTVNAEAVKFWRKLGVKRVILARELSLKEIAKIHKAVPDMELEMFVHGAMCISYSGRCLLSAYMTGREANLGDCAQPCRWQYKIHNSVIPDSIRNPEFIDMDPRVKPEDDKGNNAPSVIPAKAGIQSSFYLEEKLRPGQFYPIEETENGTYLMNSKDLCLIEHLDEIRKTGITGLKVEGRNKSIYYLGTVARAYRQALDLPLRHPEPSPRHPERKRRISELKKELETLNHRGYTTGFALGKAKKGETFPSRQPIRTYNFVAVIRPLPRHSEQSEESHGILRANALEDDTWWNFIEVRNQIKVGDMIEIITPDKVTREKVLGILDESGKEIAIVNPGKTSQMAYLKLKNTYPEMTLMRKKLKTTH